MATTEANICNMGLARLGVTEYITDLASDQSEEAETCNIFYAQLRDACLAAFPWPFATRRATLAPLAGEPARDGWQYVFAVPDGCLKPRKIWPTGVNISLFNAYPNAGLVNSVISMNPRTPRSDQRIPFAIEKATADDSQVLLCDLETAVLFYTARVVDPARFPPMFTEAFAWLIAAEVAMPLTKKTDKAEWARKMYETKIREAWADALSTGQEDVVPDSEMITGRL